MSALITEDLTPTVRRRFPAVRWSSIGGWVGTSNVHRVYDVENV